MEQSILLFIVLKWDIMSHSFCLQRAGMRLAISKVPANHNYSPTVSRPIVKTLAYPRERGYIRVVESESR